MAQPNSDLHDACPTLARPPLTSSSASSSSRVEDAHVIDGMKDKVACYETEHIMGVKVPNCGQELLEDTQDRKDMTETDAEDDDGVCSEKTLMFEQTSPCVHDLPPILGLGWHTVWRTI